MNQSTKGEPTFLDIPNQIIVIFLRLSQLSPEFCVKRIKQGEKGTKN